MYPYTARTPIPPRPTLSACGIAFPCRRNLNRGRLHLPPKRGERRPRQPRAVSGAQWAGRQAGKAGRTPSLGFHLLLLLDRLFLTRGSPFSSSSSTSTGAINLLLPVALLVVVVVVVALPNVAGKGLQRVKKRSCQKKWKTRASVHDCRLFVRREVEEREGAFCVAYSTAFFSFLFQRKKNLVPHFLRQDNEALSRHHWGLEKAEGSHIGNSIHFAY